MTNPNNNCKKNDIRHPVNTKFSQSSHATLFTHTLPIVPSLHMKNKAVFRRNKTDFGFSKRLLEVSKRRLKILKRRFKLLKRRLCSHTPVQIFRALSPYYNIPPTNTITTITTTVTHITTVTIINCHCNYHGLYSNCCLPHTKKRRPHSDTALSFRINLVVLSYDLLAFLHVNATLLRVRHLAALQVIQCTVVSTVHSALDTSLALRNLKRYIGNLTLVNGNGIFIGNTYSLQTSFISSVS